MMPHRPALLVLLAILVLALTACRPADPAWARVQETGVLRVGLDASYPPFEALSADGQPTGFDVDLAREVGRRLGVEVEFTNIAYDGLYDALVSGQVDVLISALAPAYGSQSRAVFSDPYFNAGDYLVTPRGSPVREMADLGGHTLAVEVGSGGDVEARRWQRRVAGLTVERYDTPTEALQAVLDGEADAALVDGISARLGVGEHEALTLREGVTELLFAAAVHEDSTRLLAEINDALEEIVEDGTIEALTQAWFNAPY